LRPLNFLKFLRFFLHLCLGENTGASSVSRLLDSSKLAIVYTLTVGAFLSYT